MRDAIEKVMTEKLEKERLDLALFMLTTLLRKALSFSLSASVTLPNGLGKTIQRRYRILAFCGQP